MSTDTQPLDKPVPVSGLSIYDPVHLGIDERGYGVDIELIYRNILLGGEPGSGKSVALNNIVAHAAMCTDTRLWLFDGKQVELGLWKSVSDVFVGPDIDAGLARLQELQRVMDWRYDELDRVRRRKITQTDPVDVIVAVIDEIAYYSATIGSKEQQEKFVRLVRDLVARGRAAGVIVVAATQRPSADIIPTSLRDLFGFRCAFRCTTEASSDIILGHGWAKQGQSATHIAPEDRGIGLLLAEGGMPRRMKSAYLSDADIYALVDYAHQLRTTIAY
ncbi:cell division protein FtsK [Allosaccharopolyspora coralli]|uniref:Cell division protein FtsK n=1 Tax=Allosaccharopolyspora coralli TaxID=2665642 RepID=A0A5Q3QAH9_9PSEU|nr:cell division protein FtsK [Allosaccharopolyspora coralli]